MAIKVIGITGGIASGKSTASNMVREMGFTVIDADYASRVVVEPGQKAYGEIIDQFGESILHEDGTLNREKLGAIIFTDEEKRKQLNQIVHPAVRTYMNEEREAAFERGEKIVFLDIPLLFESKLTHMVDKTVLIYVDQDVQLQRLMARNNLTKEQAKARINSQMPLSEKKALADEVIDNNMDIDRMRSQLVSVLNKWGIISTAH